MTPELFDHEIHDVSAELVPLMSRLERTVAVAESLTGGLVCGALTEIPGASAVLRGGAVTYATDSKHAVLGVSALLLGAGGPVQAQVAREMTLGVRRLYSADFGVATTGVAGPEPQSGQPVGRLFVAVGWSDADGEHDEVRMFDVPGDRSTVRARAVTEALSLLLEVVRAADAPVGDGRD